LNNKYPPKLKYSIFIGLVLIALGNYLLITLFYAPSEQDPVQETQTAQSDMPGLKTEDSAVKIEPVDVLLVGLKQRLETQKDDVGGWILLSKSYYHLNRLEEANEAFEKAKALGYTGDWMPLPRIDSSMHQESSSKKLKALANFRDHNIDESVDRQ